MTTVKVIRRKSKGGPGSGNWGHSGRPGMQGGSAPGGGSSASGGGIDSTPSKKWPIDLHSMGFVVEHKGKPESDELAMAKLNIQKGGKVSVTVGTGRSIMTPSNVSGMEKDKYKVNFAPYAKGAEDAANFMVRNRLSGSIVSPIGVIDIENGNIIRQRGSF